MNNQEKALAVYSNNNVLRGLIQSIGGPGAVVDNFLVQRRDRLHQQRFRTFIEKLDRVECNITHEQLNDDEFCHAVIVTLSAVGRTEREEKIHLFALMLSNYKRVVMSNDKDAYEEFLRVLDDMSYREFQILLILHDLEKAEVGRRAYPAEPFNFWPEFLACAMKMGVPQNELLGFLNRLTRTGCLHVLGDAHPNGAQRCGYTTPTFQRLVEAVTVYK